MQADLTAVQQRAAKAEEVAAERLERVTCEVDALRGQLREERGVREGLEARMRAEEAARARALEERMRAEEQVGVEGGAGSTVQGPAGFTVQGSAGFTAQGPAGFTAQGPGTSRA